MKRERIYDRLRRRGWVAYHIPVVGPLGLDMDLIEVLCRFARATMGALCANGSSKSVNFTQKSLTIFKERLDAAIFVVRRIAFEFFFAVTESQQMPTVDIKCDDFLEELIESLVTMGDEENSLMRKVVIQKVDNLCGYIRLAGAWWPDYYT